MTDDTVNVQHAFRSRSWRVLGMMAVTLATHAVQWIAVSYLLLPVLFLWVWFLTIPFRAFTFTDPQDFIFAGLIVLTLLAWVTLRQSKRLASPGWVKAASVAALVLGVAIPLVPMVFLCLLSRRGQELIGHWPQPMTDDPKFIGTDDPAYQSLSSAVVYSYSFAGWGMAAWGTLMAHLWGRFPWKKLLWIAAVLVLASWAFLLEPTERFSWWLD